MDLLVEKYQRKIKTVSIKFRRYLYDKIDWSDRFIAILGARGTGKTTLLLQYIKENLPINKSLYLSLDDLFFTKNSLSETIMGFEKRGVEYFFIDEVHKYPTWSIELKNLYDDFPHIKVVFTGSSILDIYKGFADLSRRVISYQLHPMSFREFLLFENKLLVDAIDLPNLLKNHVDIAMELTLKFKPIKELLTFYQYGAYPYYKENKNKYYERLENTIDVIFSSDIPTLFKLDYAHLIKLKKLLKVLSELVPYKPNLTKLAGIIEINRKSIYKYLDILERACLISMLSTDSKGDSVLAKPEKIYLNNTNLVYALNDTNPNMGTIRETFFLNQVSPIYKVGYSNIGDFKLNNNHVIEVGGKNKTYNQIKDIDSSVLVKDDLEVGFGSTIPLWMFGFLY